VEGTEPDAAGDREGHGGTVGIAVTIVGFLELLQFGVMVAVFVSFTLAVSLCVAMILDYLRD
jgi:hypothetical protein